MNDIPYGPTQFSLELAVFLQKSQVLPDLQKETLKILLVFLGPD